jgi:cellulose synthase/poly-beta-1,6-N-acetylglucosamine synthase-like glycosyltransferase
MLAAADLFLICYFLVLIVLCIYGGHRYFLVWLYYRHRSKVPVPQARFDPLPRLTIQLPMYNEPAVARRVIEAAAAIDYPRDKLEIQVLDDSTDETVTMAGLAVERLRAQGLDIIHVRRDDRRGYKAGALAHGLRLAKGEFVCIFDADFIPGPDILRRSIHYFTDPQVGMVQTRWEHLNRCDSLLTRTQAILLDGHFLIEHVARNRSGRFMSFNGTAGLWRKACILDAGGWEHDTLTEDLDLSYRAQMKGWRFVYLPAVTAPAELPPEMGAFKVQQRRWTKGGVQTLRKLLPAVMRSPLPLKVKIEAFFHLTSCTVYLFVVALTLMVVPAIVMRGRVFADRPIMAAFVDLSLFILACCSSATFYVASQRESLRSWSASIKHIPFLMCLGLGISLNNALAALSGFFGDTGSFDRTPKFAGCADRPPNSVAAKPSPGRRQKRLDWQTGLELLLGTFFLLAILVCAADRDVAGCIPFLGLFMVGYFYVGACSLLSNGLAAAETPALSPEVGS